MCSDRIRNKVGWRNDARKCDCSLVLNCAKSWRWIYFYNFALLNHFHVLFCPSFFLFLSFRGSIACSEWKHFVCRKFDWISQRRNRKMKRKNLSLSLQLPQKSQTFFFSRKFFINIMKWERKRREKEKKSCSYHSGSKSKLGGAICVGSILMPRSSSIRSIACFNVPSGFLSCNE